MNDISGRDIHAYRLWRKSDGDLYRISLQTRMGTLRVFMKWCGTIEAVDQDLFDKVLVPQVSLEEEQNDVMLEADRAQKSCSTFGSSTTHRLNTSCSPSCGKPGCGSGQPSHWT